MTSPCPRCYSGMKMNTYRFSVSAEEYLAESSALFYLNDAVTQLLEHREEFIQFGIVRYFAEYFTSVKNGNHVLFREFSYVKGTAHNRASFIHIFWKCFRQIGKNRDLLTMMEYTSLLQLLCPDFPVEIVQNTAKIVLMEDATDCPMSLSDFIYAFQIQFYYEDHYEHYDSTPVLMAPMVDIKHVLSDRLHLYSPFGALCSEFLESVLVIYEDLLEGKNPNTVIVPTSTSAETISSEETDTQEGVDSSVLLECIEGLCERFKHKHPPLSAITEVLESSTRISYYGFLMALAKHEGISQEIGALPNRSDLLIDPEMDQELERLVAQVAISPTSNSSSSAQGLKELCRKPSPRKSLHQRKRIEMESDGSTEETDSSEN